MLKSYLERHRTIRCRHSRSLAVEGIPGEQHARSCTSGEIWLWFGIPARAEWAFSNDHRALHSLRRTVHAALGRGLSKIFDHRRWTQASRNRPATRELAQIQRGAALRARRAHLLQRSPRIDFPSHRV